MALRPAGAHLSACAAAQGARRWAAVRRRTTLARAQGAPPAGTAAAARAAVAAGRAAAAAAAQSVPVAPAGGQAARALRPPGAPGPADADMVQAYAPANTPAGQPAQLQDAGRAGGGTAAPPPLPSGQHVAPDAAARGGDAGDSEPWQGAGPAEAYEDACRAAGGQASVRVRACLAAPCAELGGCRLGRAGAAALAAALRAPAGCPISRLVLAGNGLDATVRS